MSLSLVGRKVAATRQKAGRSLNPLFTESCECSSGERAKSPAPINRVRVIVVFGKASDVSVGHDAGSAGAALVGAELTVVSAKKNHRTEHDAKNANFSQ